MSRGLPDTPVRRSHGEMAFHTARDRLEPVDSIHDFGRGGAPVMHLIGIQAFGKTGTPSTKTPFAIFLKSHVIVGTHRSRGVKKNLHF